MEQLYKKNELNFALIWIGAYVVLFSVADSISARIGMEKLVTTPVCIAFAWLLWRFISRNELGSKYGLCAFQGKMKNYLYFVPLAVIMLANLWNGVTLNGSITEKFLSVLCMLCVGFIEEVIFRGLLFKAMSKDGMKMAVLISSITFGMGHIVNLLNGSALLPTLMQICYATAIGFLFTVIFIKSKSLWPCIVTHSLLNALSVFAAGTSAVAGVLTSAALCVWCLGYALWIVKRTPAQAADA